MLTPKSLPVLPSACGTRAARSVDGDRRPCPAAPLAAEWVSPMLPDTLRCKS